VNAAEVIDSVRLDRSVAERSDAEQSGGLVESAGRQVRVSVADPEVLAARGRRRFSAAYKARIVREADLCREPGDIGVLLRREGLYSSHLNHWRRDYRNGAESALADDKRGRKQTKNPLKSEVERLGRELERTQKKLRQAEMIIEFQKNLCEILGISPTGISTDEEK
jgi:transposase-like protein